VPELAADAIWEAFPGATAHPSSMTAAATGAVGKSSKKLPGELSEGLPAAGLLEEELLQSLAQDVSNRRFDAR
jgi:hypothetical protein